MLQHNIVHGKLRLALQPAPPRSLPRRLQHRLNLLFQPQLFRIPRVILHQPARPAGMKQQGHRQPRRRFHRPLGVERQTRMRLKRLPCPRVIGRPRRQNLQQRFRQRQRLRLQCLQHRLQRLHLLGIRNRLSHHAAIPPHGIPVIQPAN